MGVRFGRTASEPQFLKQKIVTPAGAFLFYLMLHKKHARTESPYVQREDGPSGHERVSPPKFLNEVKR